jgi:hypothetical protein
MRAHRDRRGARLQALSSSVLVSSALEAVRSKEERSHCGGGDAGGVREGKGEGVVLKNV